MAEIIIMPKQGLQMTEGTIIEWKKREGDPVSQGEVLFEIETDKLNIDIDAPSSGTLLKIVRQEGETVPITEMVGIIGEPGEDISALLSGSGKADDGPEGSESHSSAGFPAGSPAGSLPSAAEPEKGAAVVEEPVSAVSDYGVEAVAGHRDAGSDSRQFVTPRARWRAAELAVDLQTLVGTGPDGLVIERDVLSAVRQSVPAAPASRPEVAATPLARKLAAEAGLELSRIAGSGPRGKIFRADLSGTGTDAKPAAVKQATSEEQAATIALSGMRRIIAERMRSSLDEAAQAVHRIDVEMSAAVGIRNGFKSAGRAVTFNDIIVKATAAAVIRHPVMTRQLQDDSVMVQYRDAGIGLAVALDEGLIVPVVRDADRLSLDEIHRESRRLADAARSGTLKPDDLAGGRLTVSNLGMYGIDSFTAIINRPESCILAVGAVQERPVVIDGAIVARPVCTLSLTYDHRVIDGAPAAMFLQTLRELLQNPLLLL